MNRRYLKNIWIGLLIFPLFQSFAQSDDLNAVFADLIYDPTKSYTNGSAVVISLEDGEIYTASQDVPAAADGSNGPNGANASTYWGDSSTTTQQFEANNPTFLNDLEEVIASNDTAALSAQVGELTNPSSATGSRLINLSTRGFVGPKDQNQEMVGGFGITGTGSVKLFVRGYGPHLSQFFGASALSDPMVTIKTFPGGEEVLINKQWNASDTEWSEISDEYQPSQSGDCAAFITVEPGLYTTEVNGENGASGIGMIEIFTYDDLTSKSGGTVGNGSSSLSKLMNLSTRSYVGLKSNFQEMVGGFGISGTESVKLFVRSYGPHLTQFFGAGALSDSRVTIKTFPGEEVTLENDNWNSSDTEWSVVSDEYKPSETKDAAAFVTVQPGLFTTEVVGVNNAVGLGMIEIFTYDELNKK